MKIQKIMGFINEHGFKFVLGKEAPRLSELETLSTAELYNRTFAVNMEAVKHFAFTYFGFFFAVHNLLALGAYDYVLSVTFSIFLCLVLMNVKVMYSIYCEIKHDKIMQQK